MQKGGAIRTYEDILRLVSQLQKNKDKVTRMVNRITLTGPLHEKTDATLTELLAELNEVQERISERLARVNEVKADREKIARIDQEMREKHIRSARPDTLLNNLIEQYTQANQQLIQLRVQITTEQNRRIRQLELERIAAAELEAARRREELRAAERARMEAQRVIAEQEFENRLREIRDATDEEIIARFPQFHNRWMQMQRRMRDTIRERLDRDDGRLADQFEEFRAEHMERMRERMRAQAAEVHARIAERRPPRIAERRPPIVDRNNNNATVRGRIQTNHLPIPTELWTGFTRGDVNNLITVFDPTLVEELEKDLRTGKYKLNAEGKPKKIKLRPHRETYAVCPICLEYVDRGAGCFYIQDHNCLANGTGLYHHELYDKYKTALGKIVFCAICSRICSNAPEAHLQLVRHDAPKAQLTNLHGHPFGPELECIRSGGGGFREKIIRYNALRAKALELNKQVGKITKYEAHKQLVEAMWDSPLDTTNNVNTFEFAIPNSEFPTMLKTNNNSAKKIIPSKGFKEPDIVLEGKNSLTYSEDPPLIKFHHLDSSGSMNDHEDYFVGPGGLIMHLWSSMDNSSKKFRCPQPECRGYLYPEEVESAISKIEAITSNNNNNAYVRSEKDNEHIQRYRKIFYENFSLDGEDSGLFHELTDSTCTTGGGAGGGGAGGGGAGFGGYRRSKRIKRRNRNRRTRK